VEGKGRARGKAYEDRVTIKKANRRSLGLYTSKIVRPKLHRSRVAAPPRWSIPRIGGGDSERVTVGVAGQGGGREFIQREVGPEVVGELEAAASHSASFCARPPPRTPPHAHARRRHRECARGPHP